MKNIILEKAFTSYEEVKKAEKLKEELNEEYNSVEATPYGLNGIQFICKDKIEKRGERK